LKKTYYKEINFLRFLSISSVVIYHYFPKIISKGYLGVDLFFVISGFLISLFLFREIKNKEFKLLNFYNRRIKRIIPATIFLLFFVSFISFILFTRIDLVNYSKSLIYSIFFSSNIFFWLDGGYFGPSDKLKPLLHLWSLGVEEQFYILFPIFFLVAVKFFKNINNLIFLVLIISLVSLLLNIFLLNIGGYNPSFFLLPTRIWNFGLGILAMLIFVTKKKTHNNFEIGIYIFMIVLGFYYQIPFLPSNFIIVFFTFMLLKNKFPKRFVFDFIINNKLVQYIGLISFSLYLWHWPLLIFVEYYLVNEADILIRLFTLFISIIFSIMSYHLIEINYRYKFSLKSLLALIFISYTIFLLFFSLINLQKKTSYKINSPDFIGSASLTNFKCEISNYRLYNNKRGCIINNDLDIENFEFVIVGNSHAQMYIPSLEPYFKKYSKKALLLPMTGCLPTMDVNISKECMNKSKEYFNNYSNDESVKTVIIATTWNHNQLYDGEKFINDSNHLRLAKSILKLINDLKKLEKNVFLIGPIQIPSYQLPQNLSRLLKFNHLTEEEFLKELQVNRDVYDKNFKLVNLFLQKELKNNFIQLHKTQCDSQKCYYSNSKGIFFADGSHISKYGAEFFSKSFEIIFE
tara:strand:- start:778 stop:2670 length:1893 start_codon:yes stop_codon:yes gene_type:complete